MARTLLDEVLNFFRPDYIEHQLAHAVKDPNGRTYNRTAHLPERRKIMQTWADYLDKIKASGKPRPAHYLVGTVFINTSFFMAMHPSPTVRIR